VKSRKISEIHFFPFFYIFFRFFLLGKKGPNKMEYWFSPILLYWNDCFSDQQDEKLL